MNSGVVTALWGGGWMQTVRRLTLSSSSLPPTALDVTVPTMVAKISPPITSATQHQYLPLV